MLPDCVSKAIIVYHTVYGNTRKAAEAICEGIKEAAVEVVCKNLKDIKPEDILPFNVILLGAPTHYGGAPKEMDSFIKGLRRINVKGKQGAAFDTRYEGEETGALNSMEKAMLEMGMKIVSPGLAVIVVGGEGPIAANELSKCKEFGKTVATKIK